METIKNKEKYIDVLAKCRTAIASVEGSESLIINELDVDVQENMYELSINTLKFLLETCFNDDLDIEEEKRLLGLDQYFK